MFRRRDERGVSDIVGTMMMLGISVVAITGLTLTLADRVSSHESPTAHIQLATEGSAGSRSIQLLHAGGDAVDRGHVRAIVHVNETLAFSGDLGPLGERFKTGDQLRLGPLVDPLPVGARVDVSLYPNDEYQVAIAEAKLRVGGTTPSSLQGTMSLRVSVDGRSSGSVAPPHVTLFEAATDHSAGRKMITRVVMDLSPLGGPYTAAMHDDGTHGDRVRGDGVYSLAWLVDPTVPRGYHDLPVTAEDVAHNVTRANGRIHVVPYGMSYNTSLIQSAGIRLIKYEGGKDGIPIEEDDEGADGAAKSDLLTVHLKVDLVSDPAWIRGKWYYLNHTYFRFDSADCPHQHGCEAKKSGHADEGLYDPKHDHKGFKVYGFHLGEDSPNKPSGWFCNDPSTNVRAFKTENMTLKRFDKDKTTINYYLVLEWQEQGGEDIYEERIDATTLDADFILRRTETMDVITDGDWPTHFDDCTDR